MSSSTSSFDRFRTELWVVGSVLAVFIMMEIGLQLFGTRISANLRRIEQIPAQAEQLAKAPHPRMLILGNSYTINAIDQHVLRTMTRQQWTPKPTWEVVQFEGSGLCEWYWILHQAFLTRDPPPDVVILNIMTHSLWDGAEIKYKKRLARHFSWTSRPFLPYADIKSFDDAAIFTLAKTSLLFSRAQGIGEEVLRRLIPHYMETRIWSNDVIRRMGQADEPANDPTANRIKPTWNVLRRFLDQTRKEGIHPVFVFMPRLDPYEIPDQLRQAIDDGGGTLIDARHIADLTRDDFADRLHLNPQGKQKFTPTYVELLGKPLCRITEGTTVAETPLP